MDFIINSYDGVEGISILLIPDCKLIVCLATMGVCLSPCSLPGGGPLFQMGPHDMELGMGLHEL